MTEQHKTLLYSLGFLAIGLFLLTRGGTMNAVIGALSMVLGGLGVLASLGLFHRRTPAPPITVGLGGTSESGTLRRHTALDPESLSPEAGLRLEAVVTTMSAHGVFLPTSPEPDRLHGPLVDYGGDISPETVLMALGEADYYHPGFRVEEYDQNLVLLPSKTEQSTELVAAQLESLAALTKGVAVFEHLEVAYGEHAPAEVSITAIVSGQPLNLRFHPAAKYLSTTPFVDFARLVHELPGESRLAALWTDHGAYVMWLPRGASEALNEELGIAADEAAFGWLDEDEPFDAGRPPSRT